MSNIKALMTLKDEISYKDNFGNLHYEFPAIVEYSFRGKVVTEKHTCEVINIVGYSDIALRILTQSDLINSSSVHTEFSSAFGSFKFDEANKILTIQQNSSPKIGAYTVKITLI